MARGWNRDLAWLGAGVALGMLVAPRRGGDLRNRIGSQLLHWSKVARRTVVGRAKDLGNRTVGVAAEARRRFEETEDLDPTVLLDRVHSHLGHASNLPLSHVNLTALGRVIVVHGYVPSEEDRERLARTIREVDGVVDVSLEHLRIHPAA